jgi:prepilin-type N-terminal cleavage/methylation domain-containing protein
MKKFTLFELLVVMAIIGILSTLLMPSLRKARQKAKTAVCLGQNKQMVYSWQMAMENLDGNFFDYLEDNQIWTGHLKDYFNEDALLICPETSVVEESSGAIMGTAKTAWREGRRDTQSPWNMASYGYNNNLYPFNSPYNYHSYPTDYVTYKNQGEISAPSETPVIGDAWWRNTADMSNSLTRLIPANLSAPRSGDYSGNSINRFISNRHGKVTVLSFVDGHAKPLSFVGVYRQQWFEDYDKDGAVVNPH